MKNIKNKKLFIKLLILWIMIIITIVIIIKFMITQEDIILSTDLTCEFRQQIYTMDFVKSIKGTVIENPIIDTNKVGKQKISISYLNNYGFIITKKFEIEIKDVTAPTIEVKNPYTIEKESITNLTDTIFCADDYDNDVTCNITGNYNLNKVGQYDLKITATDHSGNKTEKEFTLNVTEKSQNKTTTKENNYTNFTSIYQKEKNEGTLIGVDLSKWQEEVDFQKIKEAGVEFVMLKIGGQTSKNSEISLDSKFYENIKKAQENNLKVGIYFYSYAQNEKESQKQAKWIISKIKDYQLELPIAFDWENWNNYTSFHISFYTLNKIASSFMQEIEANGYQSMLYSSKYYLETIWYAEDYTVWLANYKNTNDYNENYTMWQICNNGKIDGINGNVDIDILKINE